MATFSRTWWGERFIEVLEHFTDEGRLSRGRSYARNGKVLNFELSKGKITAKVRGSINPYFGVYKEPKYNVTIQIKEIPRPSWVRVIKAISSKASFVSRLLMNEMPDNIEEVFDEFALHLLPGSEKDFTTKCSCPDWGNPCKHIAGVYYLVASEFDRDPFLMFKLRGLEQEELQKELVKSPLGQVLLSGFVQKEVKLESSESYYTEVAKEELDGHMTIKEFWTGAKKIPQRTEQVLETIIPAALIKKQGDFPPFWCQDNSFIQIMEDFYIRVRDKNKKLLR